MCETSNRLVEDAEFRPGESRNIDPRVVGLRLPRPVRQGRQVWMPESAA